MQNNFLTKISHEIRTPLNAIIGFGYLCQQTRLDDQQRKYVTTMITSAKDLLNSFQEMLDFSKLEDNDFEITNLPLKLETILGDIAATIEPRCHEKHLRFNAELDPNLPPWIIGDSKNISQILLNLGSNAVKFTEKGSVQVTIDKFDNDKVRFRVFDTGIGISEDMRETIFQPFTQVDNSHTREFGGTGLGLAVCTLLIERMGGKIYVEDNEGGGSIFNIVIPLEEADPSSINDVGPLKDVRILIVEHSQLQQQIRSSQLNSFGMKVKSVHEGELAMRMIVDADAAENPYDIVLLPWQLPDMTGIELSGYLQQEELSNIPALVLQTEFNMDEVQKLAEDAGISDMISLNASNADWQEKLASVVEKHRADKLAAAQRAGASSGPPRILLVEDNEINQEIAYEVLTTAQLLVDIANNGQEAVDAVEKENYSLVLMDIQMPVMDGLTAAKCIREAGHNMPIIAMTAHATLDDKESSLSAGMNAHLTKPLEPMALFATINTWIPSMATGSSTSQSGDQAAAVVRDGKLPDRIEGFNIIGGLATMGGNEALYANLLKKFADRYATINEDISSCLQKNDIETAVRYAHTVRGIAANLGAEELAKAAENLEKSLIHSPSMITPHLRTLVVCLTNAVSAIHESLGYAKNDDNTVETAAIEDKLSSIERRFAGYALKQAVVNMERDWGHAIDLVNMLSDRLEDTKLAKTLSQLALAVEEFDVKMATELSQVVQDEFDALPDDDDDEDE